MGRTSAIESLTNILPKVSTVSLQNLAELVPAMIAVYNINSGRYVYVNKSISKILGYQPRDFIDRGLKFVTSLVHPDDLERIMARNHVALLKANRLRHPSDSEPIVGFEYRMRHVNGRWVWLLTEGSVYSRTPEGLVDYVINTSIDITDRKQAENKLKQLTTKLEQRAEDRSQRLELALKASQMGIWEWDIIRNRVEWSDQLRALFGLKPSASISYKKFLNLVHPDDKITVHKAIGKALKDGRPYKVEHRIVWPNGSEHWIMAQGQAFLDNKVAVRMIGTAMNIDQRKIAEVALKNSQLRYKTLFDSAIIGISVTDMEGNIHEMNATFLSMLGYSQQDLNAGLRWDALTPVEYKKIGDEKLRELKKYGEAKPWEKEYIRKNGKRVPVLVGVVRIPGTTNLCVTIAIDITDRQQLEALNKAKDEFIALASHQLRTPATGVKQYIGMIMEGFAGKIPNKQRFMLQKAYESNERQLKIVNDLLLVARVDAGKVKLDKKPHDLIKLIKDVVAEQMSEFLERDQKIELKLAKSLKVPFDSQYMRMMLENIINNASKYSPEGELITIEARRRAGQVVIVVKDRGVGIRKKDQPKLYQKFSRIENPLSVDVGGSGLGLYWSKKILDLHGGSLELSSRANQGSTFTIMLPTN